ncbi:MAG: Fic family protein [Deltaproteobacteria bacterium]|nr:Fic family protein [Deltaproteobacteria bacterium]
MKRVTGRYESSSLAGETVRAFVPASLPPSDPPLDLDAPTIRLLDDATSALANLDLVGGLVPSMNWFLYSFVRKEAVVSTQIEGTQTTLMDLLTFEATGSAEAAPLDVGEVCSYLDAVEYAREQIRHPRGLPISTRLLNETHRRLLAGARGQAKSPGHIRRSQNWIGGTRPGNAAYVPPPPNLVGSLLADLENFIHSESPIPALVRAGLVHVQFESIHPYLDGNGRIGRLLVSLLLEHWGILTQPLLYLSLHFKRNRVEYYRRLDAVRADGDFEGWIAFFLEGVRAIADEAVATARDLHELIARDRLRALESPGAGAASARLFEMLPDHPVLTTALVVDLLGTTKPTAARAIATLVDAGILAEQTGRRRDRLYGYAGYLERLRVGTELERA